MSGEIDFPFDVVVAQADARAKDGFYAHQKFTCAGCGQRLTMSEPNKFYRTGSCDRCPAVTNIEAQGCNYMLITRGARQH